MPIGILSDTHDELARTRRAVELLKEAGAEALVHCGDLTSPSIISLCSVLPFWFVLGNHDADSVPVIQQAAEETGATCLDWAGEILLEDRRIWVAHGHMSYDIRRALNARPDYLFSGHSHIVSDTRVGRVSRINPGALVDADRYTVALLNLITDELEILTLANSS
jgi:putative phosphoesterase